MQITVNRADLDRAVSYAKSGIGRRVHVPTMAGVWARVADSRLTLEAFDFDRVTRAHVFGDDASAGAILVNGAQLAGAVKAMPAGKTVQVRLSADDAGLTLASGPATCKVDAMPGDDYPQLPVMPPAVGMFAADDFAAAVSRVGAAAGSDDTLPVLTCIRFELADRVTMVATDRYRLATESVSWSPAVIGAEDAGTCIPAKAIAAFIKAAKGAGKIGMNYAPAGSLGLHAGFGASGFAAFITDERELIIRTTDSDFPRWRALMPADVATTATADAAALRDAVKRTGAMCERNLPMRVIVNGAVTLEAQRDGEVCGSESVPATRDGDEIRAMFNPGYLASLLAGVTGPAHIGFNAGKPARITADSAPGYTALLMPIRNAG